MNRKTGSAALGLIDLDPAPGLANHVEDQGQSHTTLIPWAVTAVLIRNSSPLALA